MVEEREYKETTEAKSKRQCQEPSGLGKFHTCLALVDPSSSFGYSPHAF